MTVLMIILGAFVLLAIQHYVLSRNPNVKEKNFSESFTGYTKRLNKRKRKLPEIGKDILDGILNILPNFRYKDTAVTRVITGIFSLLLVPIWLVLVGITGLIILLAVVIAVIVEWLEEEWAERVGERAKDTSSKHAQGFFIACLCLIAVIVFTVANFHILKIGLPVIWPVEKKPIAELFGMKINAITVLAILMIVAEFFMSLMRSLFGDRSSKFVRYSPSGKTLCLVGLLAFCGIEAALAIIRTQQMNPDTRGLALVAIGIVSFVVPLIAALAFEYVCKYLLWLICGIGMFILGVTWIIIFVVALIIMCLEALLLYVLDIFTSQARLTHEGMKHMKENKRLERAAVTDTRPAADRSELPELVPLPPLGSGGNGNGKRKTTNAVATSEKRTAVRTALKEVHRK